MYQNGIEKEANHQSQVNIARNVPSLWSGDESTGYHWLSEAIRKCSIWLFHSIYFLPIWWGMTCDIQWKFWTSLFRYRNCLAAAVIRSHRHVSQQIKSASTKRGMGGEESKKLVSTNKLSSMLVLLKFRKLWVNHPIASAYQPTNKASL